MQWGFPTLHWPQNTQYNGQRKIVTATSLHWESEKASTRVENHVNCFRVEISGWCTFQSLHRIAKLNFDVIIIAQTLLTSKWRCTHRQQITSDDPSTTPLSVPLLLVCVSPSLAFLTSTRTCDGVTFKVGATAGRNKNLYSRLDYCVLYP